jgi:hypothetical protein
MPKPLGSCSGSLPVADFVVMLKRAMWRFSDGTEVEPGGAIRGASVFAQRLRDELSNGIAAVTIWAQPSNSVEVDPNDTGLLDAWLKHMLDRETRLLGHPVRMTKRHDDIGDLPDPPWEPGSLDPNAVY